MWRTGLSDVAASLVRCVSCGIHTGFGMARVLPDGRLLCSWCEERADVFDLLNLARTEIVR